MKTFVNHVYDIDIINIYYLLDNKLSKDTSEKGKANKKEFLERLVYSIRQIIEVDKEGYKIPIDEYDSLTSYVITPDKNFDNYVYWLGLFLLGNPSLKTHLILEYHFNRWSNKMMYLNIIEFYIIDNVNENFFLVDETVVKSVSDWILYKRLHSGYSSSNPNNSSNSAQPKKTKEDLIVIDDLQYKSKDNKSPEKGDVLDSSTGKVMFPLKFSDKIVIDELIKFIESNSSTSNNLNIRNILEFKSSDETIKVIIKPKYFLNVIKGLVENSYLKGGEGILKDIAYWISYNFKFSKEYKKNYLYRILTEANGRPLKGFEKEHEMFFNNLSLEIKKSI